MSIIKKQTCDSCGAVGDLSLVTHNYSLYEDCHNIYGRLLVVCPECSKREHVTLKIPIEEVTEEVLINLYKVGFTESSITTVIEYCKENRGLEEKLEIAFTEGQMYRNLRRDYSQYMTHEIKRYFY